jgi:carbonic anhydrase
MHRRQALKILAGLALCLVCASTGFTEAAHWSYEAGHGGPGEWADIDAANRVCSVGGQQSPIDIRETIKTTLPPLKPNWARRADTIVNNGHTIQVDFADGSKLRASGGSYKLVQFHFHRPSEHQINGKIYPMELHFVHANASGGLAVVSVLMEIGKPNAVFNKIVSTMPTKEGLAVEADPAINPNGMLPRKLTYYRYPGSLTTPPCSESVDWLVLTNPIHVAKVDVESFARLYAMNARPVQKTNRRFVLRSG